MATKRTPHSDFELIFETVNAVDKATAGIDSLNDGRYLNRQEWLQCLVRCAITIYIQRGAIGDVSDAVTQLLTNNLVRNLPPNALQNSNAFRKRFCYVESTSVVLEANVKSIENSFMAWCTCCSMRIMAPRRLTVRWYQRL